MWGASVFGGSPRKLKSHARQASISPQGSLIAYLDPELHQLWVMGVNGDNAKMVLEDKDDELSTPAWSPDGQRLAYLQLHENIIGSIHTVSLVGSAPSLVVADVRGSSGLLWLPDGRILFSLREPSNFYDVNVWGVATDLKAGAPTREPFRISNWQNTDIWMSSVSSDARRLAVFKTHRIANIFVAEWKEGEKRLESPKNLTRSDTWDLPDAWSRDGRAILFTSNRSGKLQLSRLQLDSGSILPLVPGPEIQSDAQVTPDGAWILYWSSPIGSSSKNPTTTRIMRMSSSAGTPEPVAEYTEDATTFLRCPSHLGSPCVVSRWAQDRLTFYAFDIMKGQGNAVATTHIQRPNNLGWSISPDGARIAVTSDDRLNDQIRILDVNESREHDLQLPKGWGYFAATNAFTPDGKALVIEGSSEDRFLSYLELSGKNGLLFRGGKNETFDNLVFSPNGQYLTFGKGSHSSNVWVLENF